RDKQGKLLSDAERLKKFGMRLRDTSLDELPEAWNILKGDMSVIGPRPLLVRDMTFMTEEQRRRHDVTPGLSGLAQISGRNGINWETRLDLDLKYTEKVTLPEDLRIAFVTVGKVLRAEHVNSDGMATSEDLGDYLLRTGKIDRETYDRNQAEAEKLLEEFEKGR
ncbi:MAG: sugar transferase, partial [Clostridia bacterium]|nr:sugar transferase [Clostridia bacterium]